MKSGFFSSAKREDHIKLVGFFVGEVRYGIDIMQVSEIINPEQCIRVPALPDHIVGMVDHRGILMPIVDLRAKFGLAGADANKRTKWILTRLDSRNFGLQVDRVTNVLKLSQSQLRQRPPMRDNGDASWIGDVYADEAGLVFQLDLVALMPEALESV